MKLIIKLLPEAEKDIQKTMDSFSNDDPAKAQEFWIQLIESIEYLSNNPKLFPRVFKNIRQASVSKFPFMINFIFETENKKIIILAIVEE